MHVHPTVTRSIGALWKEAEGHRGGLIITFVWPTEKDRAKQKLQVLHVLVGEYFKLACLAQTGCARPFTPV